MAVVKSIVIDLGIRNVEASKAQLDAIDARAEALKKAFPAYTLKIDSAAAQQRLAVFSGQVKAAADEARKPIDMVVLTDSAKRKLLDVEAEARLLRDRFPHFTLQIDDAAAKAKLAVFAAEAKATTDVINSRLGAAGAGGNAGILARIGGSMFGGGGGTGGAAGGLGGAAPWAIGGLAGLAAVLAPSVIPLALGLGIGGLGVGGALLTGNYAQSQVVKSQQALAAQQAAAAQVASLQQRIAAATGPRATAAQRASLSGLQQQLGVAQLRSTTAAGIYGNMPSVAQAQATAAPFATLTNTFQGLGASALGTFIQALASPGPQIIAERQGPRGISGSEVIGSEPSFLQGLNGILAQLGQQVKILGPALGEMFRASLPFIRTFTDLMTQVAKILMPAFTQSMNQLVQSGALPLLEQGLTTIVKGLAGFITALGPGMKSSAMLFNDMAVILEHVLRGAGLAFAWLANVVENWAHRMRDNAHQAAAEWDNFRHRTAVIFDGIRQDIAHYWDMTWQNTIGRLNRGITDSQQLTANFQHWTAAEYDRIRHDIATAWDTIWNNTVGRVTRGISDVMGWIGGIPARITGALGKAGGVLWNWGSGVITGLLQGMGSVIGQVWDFIKSIPSKILNFLGIKSPPQWAIDAGKHIMNGIGIGMQQSQAALRKATAAAVQATQGAAVLYPGSGVARWAALAAQALKMEGLAPGLLQNVLYQMQTESGGNPNAINLWDSNAAAGDPSRGLMQVIMSTFQTFHWPGTSWNIYDPLANIAAALNYARFQYGPSLMSGGMGIGSGHGYALGTSWAAPGWAWVGERGPELLRFRGGEQVRPATLPGMGSGATMTIVIKVDPAIAAVTPDRRLGRLLAEHVTHYIKGGGSLYPAGVTPR